MTHFQRKICSYKLFRWFGCLLRLNIITHFKWFFFPAWCCHKSFATAYLTVCSLVLGKTLQMTVSTFSSNTITSFLSFSFVLSLSFTHIQTHSSAPPAQNYVADISCLGQRSQSYGWVCERTVRKQFRRHESLMTPLQSTHHRSSHSQWHLSGTVLWYHHNNRLEQVLFSSDALL